MNGINKPLRTKNELIAIVLGIILVLSSLLPWSTPPNASELIYITDIEGVRKIVFVLGIILTILTYFARSHIIKKMYFIIIGFLCGILCLNTFLSLIEFIADPDAVSQISYGIGLYIASLASIGLVYLGIAHDKALWLNK